MTEIYKTLKLEKGMYQDKNKTFSEILQELDPDENYIGTPLANLDAFQRQLKRFQIRVHGKNADTVEKFFQTSDSQALFPEYISRSITAGIDETNNLNHLVANTIKINNPSYTNLMLDPDLQNKEIQEIKEGAAIPEIKIGIKQNNVKLKKIGSSIICSYETMLFQKIPFLNITLKKIGKNFNNYLIKDAIKTIIGGDGNKNECTKIELKNAISYKDLVEIFIKLKPYNLTTLVVSPEALQSILTLKEFLNPQTGINFQVTGTLNTPLGAKIICSKALERASIIALDKNFTLNHIIAQNLQIESDKIIDKQLNTSVITMRYAFTKIFKEASIMMNCPNKL